MATITEPATETIPETLGELVDQLGGIPPDRILMRPAPGTATEADVLAAAERPRKRLCELIDGVLVEKTMGIWESQLAGVIAHYLNGFVLPRKLGIVTVSDGTIKVRPGRVRIPDVAFFSWTAMKDEKRNENPIPQVAPEIAIEVLSKSNTVGEMKRKRADYFSAGVLIVWEVDPASMTVHEYLPNGSERVLTVADSLTAEEILPNFSMSITELFSSSERPA